MNDQHGYADCCAYNLDLMTFKEEHMVSFLLLHFETISAHELTRDDGRLR